MLKKLFLALVPCAVFSCFFVSLAFAQTGDSAPVDNSKSHDVCITLCDPLRPGCESPCDHNRPVVYYFCEYNTLAADFNFLELSNQTYRAIHGALVFLNKHGGVISTAIGSVQQGGGGNSKVPFRVGGFSRLDVDIHSLVGAGSFGQILIELSDPTARMGAGVSYYESRDGKLSQTIHKRCEFRTVAEVERRE